MHFHASLHGGPEPRIVTPTTNMSRASDDSGEAWAEKEQAGAEQLLYEKELMYICSIIEESLEVKLPTLCILYGQMEKQRWEESRRRREAVRRSEKRKRQKKEEAGARKGKKVAIHFVFPMICGSGGSKSRLAKAAGAEPSGHMRNEKLHAVVARSTFPSQKCKKLTGSEHFLTFRCRFVWQVQGMNVRVFVAVSTTTTTNYTTL